MTERDTEYAGVERRGANRLTDAEMERIAKRSAEINSGHLRATIRESMGEALAEWFANNVTRPILRSIARQALKLVATGIAWIVVWEISRRLGVHESFLRMVMGG